MHRRKIYTITAAIIAAVALSGCLGNNKKGANDGAGGGGAEQDEFAAAFQEVVLRGATQDMPTELQADYSGEMRANVTYPDGDRDVVTADLNISVDWNDGDDPAAAGPFSGTASNGVLHQNGEQIAIGGTLEVDDTFANTILREEIVAGGVTTHVGGSMFHMSGNLDIEGEPFTVTGLQFGGNFYGPGAEANAGTVGGTAGYVGNEVVIGGQYYLIMDE